VDKIDPAEMARCVAAIAGMAYVVADMPGQLDRAAPEWRAEAGDCRHTFTTR
jgi:hypothetical protein